MQVLKYPTNPQFIFKAVYSFPRGEIGKDKTKALTNICSGVSCIGKCAYIVVGFTLLFFM